MARLAPAVYLHGAVFVFELGQMEVDIGARLPLPRRRAGPRTRLPGPTGNGKQWKSLQWYTVYTCHIEYICIYTLNNCYDSRIIAPILICAYINILATMDT